jgi:hypothetical protein
MTGNNRKAIRQAREMATTTRCDLELNAGLPKAVHAVISANERINHAMLSASSKTLVRLLR